MIVTLELPLARLDELAAKCGGRGSQVKVSKRTLALLVVDQTRLINACTEAGVKITEKDDG